MFDIVWGYIEQNFIRVDITNFNCIPIPVGAWSNECAWSSSLYDCSNIDLRKTDIDFVGITHIPETLNLIMIDCHHIVLLEIVNTVDRTSIHVIYRIVNLLFFPLLYLLVSAVPTDISTVLCGWTRG